MLELMICDNAMLGLMMNLESRYPRYIILAMLFQVARKKPTPTKSYVLTLSRNARAISTFLKK